MAKGIITSSGRIIDLDDPNDEVRNLPPEDLHMVKRSYGFYDSPSFSVSLKNRYYTIRSDNSQWYGNPSGREKCIREISEMNKFPFHSILKQNSYTGDLSYVIYIVVNRIQHDVQLTYDPYHPDSEMEALILWPHLNMSVMGHSFGPDRPCYFESWSRRYRAIHCAMQIAFWINDYYKKLNRNNYRPIRINVNGVFPQFQRPFNFGY